VGFLYFIRNGACSFFACGYKIKISLSHLFCEFGEKYSFQLKLYRNNVFFGSI